MLTRLFPFLFVALDIEGLSSCRTCGHPLNLPQSAHAKFVMCDCTIENSLHYVRDVIFAEDRSRIRTGHAPQLLAACRNLAITLIHRSGSSQIAAMRRSFSYHPRAAFNLLFSRATPQQ